MKFRSEERNDYPFVVVPKRTPEGTIKWEASVIELPFLKIEKDSAEEAANEIVELTHMFLGFLEEGMTAIPEISEEEVLNNIKSLNKERKYDKGLEL